MDWVAERGGIKPTTRLDLLGNGMVVVVPRGSAFVPRNPDELIGPEMKRLAMAGENVPAGRYGEAALRSTGVWEAVSDRVVRAGNVRGALEWVAIGEVETGVVYRTDALSDARVEVAFGFTASSHPPITYPAAILAGAPNPEAAQAFLDFCRTPAATELIREAGFIALQSAGARLGEAVPVQISTDSGYPPAVQGLSSGGDEPTPLTNPWSAIRLSFLVALGATLAGLIPAMGLGWVLARREFFGKSAVATLVLAPLVLPPVVTGFLLLSVLGTQSPLGGWLEALGLPVPFTLLGATLAALTVGLPLYVVSVRNAFQTVDPRFEEVSWTLGRRPWPTFLRITLPLALPGIAAGAVLAFARALGEFGATVVLAGNVEGSTRTIALAVYTLLESPSGRETIWVLVGASVLLSLLALLGYEILSRRQRRQMETHHGR
jgi:molybdate transport system permease protein